MERLVRLASALHHAGKAGVEGSRLIEIAQFTGEGDPASQLAREFKHLKNQGWQIDNIAEKGMPARYRMTSVDNRLRLKLTPGQQAALRRAVLLADRDDLVERLGLGADERPPEVTAAVPVEAHDEALATVVNALRHGCLLRFRYKGNDRVVHPQSVKTQYGKWYLGGCDDGSDVTKAYVVSRMSDVTADAPGTAQRQTTDRHVGLHPMTWEVDPPVDVTLRAPADYVADVRRWLGTPSDQSANDGLVDLVYRVTHRAALRARLYELGPRVQLVGPEDVRREVLAELADMAGE